MVIEFRGRHNDRLVRFDTDDYPLCQSVVIELAPPPKYREHFPPCPERRAWNPKRKIADLPEPPAEVR